MTVDGVAKSPWGSVRRRRGNQFPEKREAVLKAAATLFRRNGYEGGSLAELAEILNVTKPTLYYYVGSKDELFSEIVTRAHDELNAFIKTVVTKDTTGVEKIREVMLKYFEIINSDFGACIILATRHLSPEIDRQIRSRARIANDMIYDILLQGQKDGTLTVPEPTIVLQTLFGSLNWTPRWYKPTGRVAPHKAAEMQVEMLIDGVRTPASRASTPARKPATRRKR